MHELSIALGIIDGATEEAERLGAVAVKAVHLKLGVLSGVVKSALLSAYELAREGSPLADAELLIEDVPITVSCPACGCDRPVESIQNFRCLVCGAPASTVVGGRELEIVGMEIES